MFSKDNFEFYEIILDILETNEFKELKSITHHGNGMTRYDHSLRVAYYTYVITKSLRLNCKKATRGALLHDFFFTSQTSELTTTQALKLHPEYACENATKYFNISKLEEDIIKKHMFPITKVPPRYLESFIVNIIDNCASVYEKSYSTRMNLSTANAFLLILLVNYIKII